MKGPFRLREEELAEDPVRFEDMQDGLGAYFRDRDEFDHTLPHDQHCIAGISLREDRGAPEAAPKGLSDPDLRRVARLCNEREPSC